ncbi:MAG: photosystem II stability/assembly factor-like uncharacterized protein [Roseivirga sp.]|jgi:photosystem II stability/assembly factor-like uncharacterized protein
MKLIMNKSIHLLSAVVILLCLSADFLQAQKVPANVADNIHFRQIGPTRQGGRYVDLAVVDKATKVIYAATASGGVWKTVNNGISWKPIFDNENIISVGAVAVDQQDTSVVWVGSGEANNSRSSYYGNGVYKSTNGGESWSNMGLPESQHIGRILIDPNNSNTVYVAALGHLYSDNAERGLYKTTNGGKSWSKVLEVKKDDGKFIGVVDVSMDPKDPNTLIAAAYDKIRTPWTFNEGGEGSGIYKSTDAGKSWKKLGGGLPTGFLGRIGVAHAPNNPKVVYANIENVNVDGISEKERRKMLEVGIPLESGQKVKGVEMYRSADGGESWSKISPDGVDIGGAPSYYYQQVRVDPNDADHVYVIGIQVWETKDAGKNWGRAFNFGGDNHAMWIDPADSEHIVLGYDHGMGITYDAGKNWYHPDEIPLAQFYAVDVDMAYPYNVYGGLQDNGSVMGPSSKRNGSIGLEDWSRTGGGDGMYNVVDRTTNRYLYNESQFGPIQRVDLQTGESKSIRYADRNMRWNWNAPIAVSQHNSDVIYHSGNKVLKSNFRGESWEEISGDLTKNDPVKAAGTGNIQYGTITSFEESPIDANELWVGTDDGNVQVTTDGGKNWTLLNANIPNNPEYWVTRIEASAHTKGTAYVSFNGMRRDKFEAHLYKTTDFGKTWSSIAAGLPKEPVNVIREDHINPNLLFVGTELSIYTSIDAGKNWTKLTNNYPSNPAYDMVIHPRENELVVATHGRGIFIADITPLQGLTAQVASADMHLFDIQPAVKWVRGMGKTSPYINFDGESRQAGVHVHFHAKTAGNAKVSIFKGQREIYKSDIKAKEGLNSMIWGMDEIVRERSEEQLTQMRKRYERFGMSGADLDSRIEASKYITSPVQPATFTVVLEMNGKTMSKEAVVMPDYWYK